MSMLIDAFNALKIAILIGVKNTRLKDGEYYRSTSRYGIERTNFDDLRSSIMSSNIIGNMPEGHHLAHGNYIFMGKSILGGTWIILCRPNKDNKEERKFFESIK